MASNQGRDTEAAIKMMTIPDLQELARTAWAEVHAHPAGASCECVVIEVLAHLLELGYTIGRNGVTFSPVPVGMHFHPRGNHPVHECSPEYCGRHAPVSAPEPLETRGPPLTRTTARGVARSALYAISDWFCGMGLDGEPTADGEFQMHPRRGIYRITFWAGHLIGEAGWRLR